MFSEEDNVKLKTILAEEIRSEVSKALRVDIETISLTKPMRRFGVDSISASEITQHFREKYQLPVTPTILFEVRNLSEFMDFLVKQFNGELMAFYEQHEAPVATDESKPTGPLLVGEDDQNVSHIVEKELFDDSKDFESVWASLEREQRENPDADRLPIIESESELVVIDNEVIEFRILGEGEPIVLIGGLSHDIGLWGELLPALSQRNKIIVYYPPGHGKSTLAKNVASVTDIAKLLKLGLDDLKLTEAMLVIGHGIGGSIALALAIQFPRCVKSLSLISTSAKSHPPHHAFEHIAKEFEKLEHKINNASIVMPFSKSDVMQYYKSVFEKYDISHDLEKISCPVSIFHGDSDEYITPENAIKLQHSIKNSILFSIPQGGHFILLTHPNDIVKNLPEAFQYKKKVFKGEERLIHIPGYTFAALEWGSEDGIPVIALHGILDNAASFSFLAPRLSNLHIVALDSPGCGHSSHRCEGSIPSFTDEVFLILQVATELGWDKFTLLGHSYGACTAQLIAAACPERINALITIDSVGMPAVKAEDSAVYLKQSVNSFFELAPLKTKTIYSSLKKAAETRMALTPMNYESAQALVERGMVKVDEGYTWVFSPLDSTFSFPIRYTEDIIRGILSGIEAPTCLIIPEDGIYKNDENINKRIACIKNNRSYHLPGRHYIHMDDPENVAEAIQGFLSAAHA